MPPAKNGFLPRKGQQDLIKYLPSVKPGETFSIQWPTGYGKSIGMALAWRHLHANGSVNRLLLVVANDVQRKQIQNDFGKDCQLVGAPCRGGVWAFQRSASDIQRARSGKSDVFVATVQQLHASIAGAGVNTLKDLLHSPMCRWLVCFDEFHHYGQDMPWGDAANAAMEYAEVTMAMSATPWRRGVDTIFPEPALKVLYSKAVEEQWNGETGAVKPMVCESYNYKVTVIEEGKDPVNYTTTELFEEAVGGLETWEERRNIRYSPQYIQPLILQPMARLMNKRAETGLHLQMIVRAMSCLHAKMLANQISNLCDFSVDWIGSGPNGRTTAANEEVVAKFCPPKDSSGNRPAPSLDVLVQVSMAGEGFDSINVAEIVDLYPVSKRALNGRCTQDKQFYGRGSRKIRGHDVSLHISIPTDHPLHVFAGHNLHEWMDAEGELESLPEPRDEPACREQGVIEFPAIPPRREVELLDITAEDEHFRLFAEESFKRGRWQEGEDMEELLAIYKSVARHAAEQESDQARIVQLRDYINCAVGKAAYLMAKRSDEIAGSHIGRFKKEINSTIIRTFGKRRDEIEDQMELERIAEWIRNYVNRLGGSAA